MDTLYLKVNEYNPQIELINQAVEFLQKGQLVAFPTETVYGVGAYTFNSYAVKEIYNIKNRPTSNPLLVHISNLKQVDELVRDVPPLAYKLMERFWPGPLSLILPVHYNVPSIVTGGLDNVGLRMPSNEVAIKLIERSGPLAATSANLSGHPSPTTAQHVIEDLNGKIAAIIDSGPTRLGIESTIIDFSQESLKILRLGSILIEEIEDAIGMKLEKVSSQRSREIYNTGLRVVLTNSLESFDKVVNDEIRCQKKVGIVFNNYFPQYSINNVKKEYILNINKPSAEFFSLLRDAKSSDLEVLVFAPFPRNVTGINQALLDRIDKAADLKV